MKNTKNIKKFIAFLFVLFIIFSSVFSIISQKNKTFAYNGDYFSVDDEAIYYVGKTGCLCRFSIKDNQKERLEKNFALIASDKKYLVSCDDNSINVYNKSTGALKRVENVVCTSAAVCNETIFYTNKNDNNYIYSFNIQSGDNVLLLSESSEKISANKDYIFYEKDKNAVYRYDRITGESEKIFDGQYCFFFTCDDDYVYLSDYRRNNKITQINISTKEPEALYDISALYFCILHDKLYYSPYSPNMEFIENDKIKYNINLYDPKQGDDIGIL